MRYFTPQLYQQFNSDDEAEADRADAAWEAALEDYRRHLDGLRERMPSNVAKLAALNLHDAEILSRVEETQPGAPLFYPDFPHPFPLPFWSAVALVSARVGEDVILLLYSLWDHVREHPAPDDWVFSKSREHWLYDEVDLASDRRGPFVHRILLSTGVEVEIPFTTVVIHRFAVHPDVGAAKKRA